MALEHDPEPKVSVSKKLQTFGKDHAAKQRLFAAAGPERARRQVGELAETHMVEHGVGKRVAQPGFAIGLTVVTDNNR
jgi:hypothetical protein